jgi:hypothetical protein
VGEEVGLNCWRKDVTVGREGLLVIRWISNGSGDGYLQLTFPSELLHWL